jgi:glucose-fructose oxidoreductase
MQTDVIRRARPARLRLAVIGQGHFAQAAVLPAIAQLHDVELTALVSGSSHKLDELGERYAVRHTATYDDLDELFDSGAVDAAYIAVPNDLHAQMTVTAARHGIHVICETRPDGPVQPEQPVRTR